MAKITKEQYDKWTNQANANGNGWGFDLRYFAIWGEKEVIKRIPDVNGEYIQWKIGYYDEYEEITNQYGCKYRRATGRYIPTWTVNRLIPLESGCYRVLPVSEHAVGEIQNKKNYAYLCKCIKEVEGRYTKIVEEVG